MTELTVPRSRRVPGTAAQHALEGLRLAMVEGKIYVLR